MSCMLVSNTPTLLFQRWNQEKSVVNIFNPRWPNRRRQARLSGECGTTLALSRLFSPLARMAPMLVPKSYCDPGTLIHHFAQKKNSPLGLALVLYKGNTL